MSGVSREEWDRERPAGFQKISRVSAMNKPRTTRGLKPKHGSPEILAEPPSSLEGFSLEVESPPKDQDSNQISGFTSLELNYTRDEAMREFRENFRGLPDESYWLDTSFMIRPNMIRGVHPDFGKLTIHEGSFTYALDHGLKKLGRPFRRLAATVKRTTKAHSKALREAIHQPYAHISPQVREEIEVGVAGLTQNLEKHQRLTHLDYSRIVEAELHRVKLVQGALEERDRLRVRRTQVNPDLESELFHHAANLTEKYQTGTGDTDNHLVAHALARGIEDKVPQIVLTRDRGIYRLAQALTRNPPPQVNGFSVPQFYLNDVHHPRLRLHTLELIPEF